MDCPAETRNIKLTCDAGVCSAKMLLWGAYLISFSFFKHKGNFEMISFS